MCVLSLWLGKKKKIICCHFKATFSLSVQTHLIPHNYTAGLKHRIDVKVCCGAIKETSPSVKA